MKCISCVLIMAHSISAMQSPRPIRPPNYVDMPKILIERTQDFPGVAVVHRGDTPEPSLAIPRRNAQSPLARPASQEIHIHIEDRKDSPSVPHNSSEGSEDTIPKHRHNRRMIVSNSASVIIATLVTASVTLAIHFSNCKKN